MTAGSGTEPPAGRPSVGALIRLRAVEQPDQPFATWLGRRGEEEILTYADLDRRTRDVAHLLAGHDRVALCASNDLATVVALLAALRAGVPCLVLDPRDPPVRRQEILAEHPCGAVVRSAAEPRAAVPGIPEIAVQARMPEARASIDADCESLPSDPALLFCTSGSTAASKVVVQPHRAVASNASAVAAHHGLRPGTTVLGGLPLHHVNGVHFTVVAIVWSGAHVVLPQEISPFSYRNAIDRHRPDLISAVPSVLELLLATSRGWRPPVNLRYVVSAAAPLSRSVIRRCLDQLGVRVLQGYGLTETTNFSTSVPADASDETYAAVALDPPIPSIGVVIDGDVEVLDTDLRPLPEHEVGELCMQGDNLMSGYSDRPDLTEEAFRGGWFHSGDLGFWSCGPDGRRYLFITGRAKNVAKVRGESVSLEEVERALVSIPQVHDAACLALPHRAWGERIVALVVAQGDLAPVRAGVAEQLPAAAVPTEWHQVGSIPRTPTGKLQRHQLARMLRGAP